MHLDLLEPLEPRTHFSTATVVRTGNILTITGTEGADEISIAAGKPRFEIIVNGQNWNVLNRVVTTVRIYGLAGNDQILVSPNFNTKCKIVSGNGNDLITGGQNSDSIWGQAGNDTIYGNAGGDYLDGGPGDDIIFEYANRNRTIESYAFLNDLPKSDFYRYYQNVIHGGAGMDTAYIDYDRATGVENLRNPSNYPITEYVTEIKRKHGRVMLSTQWHMLEYENFSYDSITKASDGSYLLKMTYNFDNAEGQESVIRSSTIDITKAKGAKIFIQIDRFAVSFVYPDEHVIVTPFLFIDRL